MEVNALDHQMKQNLVIIKIVQQSVNGKASDVWEFGRGRRKEARETQKNFATLKIVPKFRISCKINLKLLKHSLWSYKGLVERFCNLYAVIKSAFMQEKTEDASVPYASQGYVRILDVTK